ncbi:S41 family peptidase [Candidatus Peregrinibacteria bacterium]|nr:MAG: S41 family peptidase [Candidatus Peregrinibacteria bacterium]
MKTVSNQHRSHDPIPKFLGLVILVSFVFVLGWHVGLNQKNTQGLDLLSRGVNSAQTKESVNLDLFWKVWQTLADDYVDPNALVTQEMVYGAISGMVYALDDPYTAFFTPKENQEFQNDLEGTLDGIGAELTIRNHLITVVSPLKNSPAKQAGLLPEDVILQVDGEDVADLSLEQVVRKIRGPRGTKVVLTIARASSPQPISISINRKTIHVDSVDWHMEEDIAVVELSKFGSQSSDEFSKAISEILPKRPKGIVLDLRFNGGGLFNEAIAITSEFIESGEIVSIQKRDPEMNEVHYANGKARLSQIPLVVLINRGSASASEILAGAIRDHKGCTDWRNHVR